MDYEVYEQCKKIKEIKQYIIDNSIERKANSLNLHIGSLLELIKQLDKLGEK